MGDRDITTVLLSIGGTVCSCLVVAIKILWSRVESLTDTILKTTQEVGELKGKRDYIVTLHKEVLKIVEESSKNDKN